MGKEKYLDEIEDILRKSPVVNLSSITRMMRSKKKIKQYQKHVLRNKLRKGKIKRLTKGCYTMHDNPSLAVFCFKPSYLGLQDALSLHELWEQETIPVILTAATVRQGIRDVLGTNVLIRRIDRKYLFGFDYYKQGETYLPYSDIEKTFIDMVYFKQPISSEAMKNIAKRIDAGKLKLYLRTYSNKFRDSITKRLEEIKKRI